MTSGEKAAVIAAAQTAIANALAGSDYMKAPLPALVRGYLEDRTDYGESLAADVAAELASTITVDE